MRELLLPEGECEGVPGCPYTPSSPNLSPPHRPDPLQPRGLPTREVLGGVATIVPATCSKAPVFGWEAPVLDWEAPVLEQEEVVKNARTVMLRGG